MEDRNHKNQHNNDWWIPLLETWENILKDENYVFKVVTVEWLGEKKNKKQQHKGS